MTNILGGIYNDLVLLARTVYIRRILDMDSLTGVIEMANLGSLTKSKEAWKEVLAQERMKAQSWGCLLSIPGLGFILRLIERSK